MRHSIVYCNISLNEFTTVCYITYAIKISNPESDLCPQQYCILEHYVIGYKLHVQSYMSLLLRKLAFRILPECTTVPTSILVHFERTGLV